MRLDEVFKNEHEQSTQYSQQVRQIMMNILKTNSVMLNLCTSNSQITYEIDFSSGEREEIVLSLNHNVRSSKSHREE
jgi:hypothetical protein